MNTFTIGEKVVLQTSPYMPVLTITDVNKDGSYHVLYQDKSHKVVQADYSPTVLQKYVDPATIYILR